MGDGIKLYKDKRHRSSSSIAAVPIEGARSERKLDIRASIPEVDDQFTLAESRCNNLQQKIELIKNVKKKKKSKRRSTRVPEAMEGVVDNVPVITVHTKLKQKVSQQTSTAVGHQQVGSRVPRLGQRVCTPQHTSNHTKDRRDDKSPRLRWTDYRRGRADGDASERSESQEATFGDDVLRDYTEHVFRQTPPETYTGSGNNAGKCARSPPPAHPRPPSTRREVAGYVKEKPELWQDPSSKTKHPRQKNSTGTGIRHAEERPLVELFNKRASSPEGMAHIGRSPPPFADELSSGQMEDEAVPVVKKKEGRHRRVVVRSRHYETPTISSQMKRCDGRLDSVRTDIPFVVSSSTAPSHNLGVNLQQILNSLKTQQPPKGIPLTIAHHLGMGHLPTNNSKSATTPGTLEVGEFNAIRAGGRLLRVPQRRQLSYRRALTLLRAGEGILPRYLRTVVRPRSMYDLSTRADEFVEAVEDQDGGEEVKRRLAEYAGLYRKLERMNERLAERPDPELERQRRQLTKELNAREALIRKIVEDYGNAGDSAPPTLRASASNAEDAYRHSTLKLNIN